MIADLWWILENIAYTVLFLVLILILREYMNARTNKNQGWDEMDFYFRNRNSELRNFFSELEWPKIQEFSEFRNSEFILTIKCKIKIFLLMHCIM